VIRNGAPLRGHAFTFTFLQATVEYRALAVSAVVCSEISAGDITPKESCAADESAERPGILLRFSEVLGKPAKNARTQHSRQNPLHLVIWGDLHACMIPYNSIKCYYRYYLRSNCLQRASSGRKLSKLCALGFLQPQLFISAQPPCDGTRCASVIAAAQPSSGLSLRATRTYGFQVNRYRNFHLPSSRNDFGSIDCGAFAAHPGFD
jgi:hypothetical protein